MLTPKQKARLAEVEGLQINIKGGHATNNTPGLYHPKKQTQKKYKKTHENKYTTCSWLQKRATKMSKL